MSDSKKVDLKTDCFFQERQLAWEKGMGVGEGLRALCKVLIKSWAEPGLLVLFSDKGNGDPERLCYLLGSHHLSRIYMF